MRRAVLIMLVVLFVSGCAIYQGEVYTQIKREPVEAEKTNIERPAKPEKWYEAIAQAVVGIVPSILRELRLTVSDTTETISSSVRDVKTGTAYEEVTYKRRAWFSTKPASFEFLQKPEKLEALKKSPRSVINQNALEDNR